MTSSLSSEIAQLAQRLQPSDPYIQSILRRTLQAGSGASRARIESRGQSAIVRAAACRGLWVSRRARLVPADAARSAHDAARFRERRHSTIVASRPGGAGSTRPRGSRLVAYIRQRRGQLCRRPIIVAVDPGHGGEDPGAVGPRGTYEKNVTLAIANRLVAMLGAQPGMRAMLTRDDDYFVPLNVRVQKARRVQADLFISIHADAFHHADRPGFVGVRASRSTAPPARAARWLRATRKPGRPDRRRQPDSREPFLARTLLDLSQTAQINDSLRVGCSVLDGIGGDERAA